MWSREDEGDHGYLEIGGDPELLRWNERWLKDEVDTASLKLARLEEATGAVRYTFEVGERSVAKPANDTAVDYETMETEIAKVLREEGVIGQHQAVRLLQDGQRARGRLTNVGVVAMRSQSGGGRATRTSKGKGADKKVTPKKTATEQKDKKTPKKKAATDQKVEKAAIKGSVKKKKKGSGGIATPLINTRDANYPSLSVGPAFGNRQEGGDGAGRAVAGPYGI